MKIFMEKIREATFSIAPIFLIVLILSFFPVMNIGKDTMIMFGCATVFAIIGVSLFTLGADLAMSPMGEHIGSGLAKKKKLSILLIVTFLFGLFITIAEPDLTVLANQVSSIINSKVLIFGVGLGVGLFTMVAVLRLVFKKNLSKVLMVFYMLIFGLAILVDEELLPLALDSGGVTTGPITVPFIMALGIGLANVLSERKASENSFGFVGLCSVGPIVFVLLIFLFSKGDATYSVSESYDAIRNWQYLGHTLLEVMKNVSIALGLIVVFFTICQVTFLHLPKKRLIQIAVGIIYTYVGLVIFMTSVDYGFIPVGFHLGQSISSFNQYFLIILGFVLGMVVVLAEPSVHVLTKQVEEVTGGYITRKQLLVGLSIGVGLSLALSMMRIVFDLHLMYFIVPGYFISLGLAIFVPNIYTAIAFDSGGVASGPMTSTFILPFAIGACIFLRGEGNVLIDAFGVVAMVAMTPLITIQLLGFKAIVASHVRQKIAMKRILDEDDEQIINFL